jgi:hypothetical protein
MKASNQRKQNKTKANVMACTSTSYDSSSPSVSASTQSIPNWNKDYASTGGWMHTVRSPRPEHFFTGTPSRSPSPTAESKSKNQFMSPRPDNFFTSTLSRSPSPSSSAESKPENPSNLFRNKKRFKRMLKIKTEVSPEDWQLAWIFMGIHSQESPVLKTLQTGFNLMPSLDQVFQIYEELGSEYDQVYECLVNHGCGESNFKLSNFMRDMMKIPYIAMNRMRQILAKCKCCEKHQTRRLLCEQKKLLPGYNIYTQPIPEWDDCNCPCRYFMRRLEEALDNKDQLQVKGQLWERSI